MIVLYVIAGVCCLISLALWAGLVRRISSGKPLFNQQPQVPVPWGLLDVYLIFAVCIFVVPLAFALLAGGLTGQPAEKSGNANGNSVAAVEGEAQPDVPAEQAQQDLAKQALLQAAAKVSAIVLAIGFLFARHRTDLHDLGFSLACFGTNVKLGVIGFFLVVPPVIALQSLLTLWMDYEHPTLDALTADRSTITFLAVLVSAGIVTPIFEEFIFRVLIQGFLQRWAAIGRKSLSLVLLGGRMIGHSSSESRRQVPLWPIFASAAIFALMHSGQGPAPIPLYFLAIGLGYLYWRTHSAIPGIIIHLLLNVWSLIFLAVQNAKI